jgi:hypothetical protein
MLHVPLISQLCVLSQYRMCLLFVHSVFCLNTSCVSALSISCLVSILHVSLVCPLCVFSQYWLCLVCPFSVLFQSCLCLWFVHSVSYPNASCDWSAHYVSCPNNVYGSGVFILCLVPILSVCLICPSYVLSQYYLFLWFINSESCLNAACASD